MTNCLRNTEDHLFDQNGVSYTSHEEYLFTIRLKFAFLNLIFSLIT